MDHISFALLVCKPKFDSFNHKMAISAWFSCCESFVFLCFYNLPWSIWIKKNKDCLDRIVVFFLSRGFFFFFSPFWRRKSVKDVTVPAWLTRLGVYWPRHLGWMWLWQPHAGFISLWERWRSSASCLPAETKTAPHALWVPVTHATFWHWLCS